MITIIAPTRNGRVIDFTRTLRSLSTTGKPCYSTAKLLFPAAMFINGSSYGIEAFGGMLVLQRIARVNSVICNTAGYTTHTTAIFGLETIVVDIGAAYDASAFSGSTLINFWYTGYSGETPSTQGGGGGIGIWYDGVNYGGSFGEAYGFNAYPPPACGSKPVNYMQLTVSDHFAFRSVAKP